MKLKKLLSLALSSIFIISQSAIAANKESGASQNNDTSNNVINYTKYPRAVNANDPVTIPDSQLKALINKTLDTNRSETQDITRADMEILTILGNTIGNKKYNITDLSGLEYAVNLTRLSIEGDYKNKLSLKNVDIIQYFTKLSDLAIRHYDLKMIDLSNNTNLDTLYLGDNNLSTIDISKNTNLKYLYLGSNNLSTIDINKNTNLQYLDLRSNNLSTIDVSKNTNLQGLNLKFNNLSTIDVSKNTNLQYLDLGSNNLSTIDVSKNTNLQDLYLDFNKLSTIDVSKNIELIELNLSNNKLLTIDVSKNTKLTNFEAGNQIIHANLDNITLQNDKVIIKNKVQFNGAQIGNITGTGVTHSPDDNTVTIDNPSKAKLVSYNFSNVDNTFSGTVTVDLSVTGVALSSTNSTLKVGETLPLTATVIPNAAIDKSVTWTSSNEKIATVDQNGLVTAVGEGTATITVKTNDGGFIATSNITVNSTNQDSNNTTGIGNTTNPQTGVAGISGILAVAGLGLFSAFASRKRKNK